MDCFGSPTIISFPGAKWLEPSRISRKQAYDFRLHLVRVLKLVHEHGLELRLAAPSHVFKVPQEVACLQQQVIEIQNIGGALPGI